MAKKAAQKSRRSKKKKKFTPRSVRLRSRGAGSGKQLHVQTPPALVEKLREFEAQADAYWAASPKISDKDRAAVDHILAAEAGVAAAPAPIGGAAALAPTAPQVQVQVQVQLRLAEVLPGVVKDFPLAPGEKIGNRDGRGGYAERLHDSDPKQAAWSMKSIYNLLYELNLVKTKKPKK